MAFRSVKHPINLLNMDVSGDNVSTFWVPSVNPSMRAGNLAQPAVHLYCGEIRGPRRTRCYFMFGSCLVHLWLCLVHVWSMFGLCFVYVLSCLVMLGRGLVMSGQGAEFDFAVPFDFLRGNGFGPFMQRSTYKYQKH